MIPRVIHYCWFGRGNKPELVERCIASWQKFCPDYEIIEWNEDNFDIAACRYALEAYEARKWAFVSDYARLYVLVRFGGIYLDTDMELFSPLDPYLENNGILGFESRDYVGTAIIGSTANNALISDMLHLYESSHFVRDDGTYDTVSNVCKMRSILLDGGLRENGRKQAVAGFTVYPQNVFFPNSLCMLFGKTPKHCVSIHHALASWRGGNRARSRSAALRAYLVGLARNTVGTDFLMKLKG